MYVFVYVYVYVCLYVCVCMWILTWQGQNEIDNSCWKILALQTAKNLKNGFQLSTNNKR